MMIGAGVCGWFLHKRLGAFVPVASLVRVVLAVAVAVAVGRVIPFKTPLMALVEAAVVGVVFLVVLIATRELGKADRVLRKGPGIARAHLCGLDTNLAIVEAFGAETARKLQREVNLLKQTLVCREEG